MANTISFSVIRINVVGTTGSGKSTFSKNLSAVLNIPHVQIDQVYWEPNWREPSDEKFFPKLETAIDRENWILDGNYNRTVPVKWKEVQAVIWLDYPFRVVFYRSVKRAIKRSLSKEELWKGTGNRESFRRSFFSRDSILLWVLKTYWKNKEQYSIAMRDSRFAHIQFIRFGSPKEAETFLEKMKKQ